MSSAIKQLRKLQQALYDQAFAEAQSVVAGTSQRILTYSRNFEASLPAKADRATLTELLETLRKRQFLLYGDFHTLRQSQRGLLRLMRSYVERLKSRKLVLALEMFKARDQELIDAYMDDRLSEHELLERTNYLSDWGFPWPNFKMILDYAKALGMPVIGINTDAAGRDGLGKRDKFAAKILVDAAEQYPEHKIICLIGEYHLADSHLPTALWKELKERGNPAKILRVVNNVDRYYFQIQRGRPSVSTTEYLRLKKDFYCIMNTPPWMKWQSFSMWEEMRHSEQASAAELEDEIDVDPDFHTEESFDVDYQFLHFVRSIADFIGIKVDESDLQSFYVHYSPEGNFFAEITESDDVDPAEVGRLIERASVDGVYFHNSTNSVLLTYLSINNLAEAAGQYLHARLARFDDSRGEAMERFYRRVIKAAVGMIASKILNPRRKAMELSHFRQFVRRHRGRALTGHARIRRETARAVLKHHEWMTAKTAEGRARPKRPLTALLRLDAEFNYEISREIGVLLGNSLYARVIQDMIPASAIKDLFRRRIGGLDDAWAEVVRLYSLML